MPGTDVSTAVRRQWRCQQALWRACVRRINSYSLAIPFLNPFWWILLPGDCKSLSARLPFFHVNQCVCYRTESDNWPKGNLGSFHEVPIATLHSELHCSWYNLGESKAALNSLCALGLLSSARNWPGFVAQSHLIEVALVHHELAHPQRDILVERDMLWQTGISLIIFQGQNLEEGQKCAATLALTYLKCPFTKKKFPGTSVFG